MAQDQNNGGFALPAPQSPTSSASGVSSEGANTVAQGAIEVSTSIVVDTSGTSNTSSRDMVIAGVVLLVLIVAFFFARGAYANTLVAKRVPPNKANASGWWLFIFLTSIAVGVVLAVVNPVTFLAPMFVAPLGLVAFISIVLMVLSGRK